MLIGHTGMNWALKFAPAFVVNLTVLGEPVGATLLAAVLPGHPRDAVVAHAGRRSVGAGGNSGRSDARSGYFRRNGCQRIGMSSNVVATRGDAIESRHHVHAVVRSAEGVILGSAGDPSLLTVWRSCAKPFQASRSSSRRIRRLRMGRGGAGARVRVARRGAGARRARRTRCSTSIGLEEGDSRAARTSP